MKILIVDDEFNARRVIRKMLSDHYDSLNFLNDASSVEEAIEIIKMRNPTLYLWIFSWVIKRVLMFLKAHP